jgi:hypothetical protein
MNILIDDWQTWVGYASAHRVDPSDHIITESPGVYEALRDEYRVFDISKGINPGEAYEMGEWIVKLSLTWQAIIDKAYGSVVPDLHMGTVMGVNLPRIMILFCHHFILLDQFMKETGETLLIPYMDYPQNDLYTGSIRKSVSLICNGFALAAQSPEGPKGIQLMKLPVPAAGQKGEPTGRIHHPARKPNLNNRLLRFASVHNHIPSLFAWRFLIQKPFARSVFKRWARSDDLVFIYRRSGPLLRAIFPLLRRRIGIIPVEEPPYSEKTEDGILAKATISLSDMIGDALSDMPEPYLPLRPALMGAAIRIEKYIHHVLIPKYKCLRSSLEALFSKSETCRRRVLLTNSLADPEENVLAALFRKMGIPVINFQHGGIGLLKIYGTYQRFSDMTRSDGYVCFNKYEHEFYRELTGHDKLRFFVQGTKGIFDAPLPRLARKFARRGWGIDRGTKTLLYAPTRFKEGRVWLPHDLLDMKYWSWMRRLVFDVMGQAKLTCVIKLHQKGLSPSSTKGQKEKQHFYEIRKNPLTAIDLPRNVRIQFYPELNYSRFAADILMIDRATSTIGWVLASNIPFIYLNHPLQPLREDIRDIMKESVFLIDVDKEGWKETLIDLLNLPVQKLTEKWKHKGKARERFNRDYVLGPRKGADGMLRWILDVKPIGS